MPTVMDLRVRVRVVQCVCGVMCVFVVCTCVRVLQDVCVCVGAMQCACMCVCVREWAREWVTLTHVR